MGYKQAKDINVADLVILNTCAVRENAEKKVFGEIGFLKGRLDPNLVLCLEYAVAWLKKKKT